MVLCAQSENKEGYRGCLDKKGEGEERKLAATGLYRENSGRGRKEGREEEGKLHTASRGIVAASAVVVKVVLVFS